MVIEENWILGGEPTTEYRQMSYYKVVHLNVCNVINQYYLNKFIFKKGK